MHKTYAHAGAREINCCMGREAIERKPFPPDVNQPSPEFIAGLTWVTSHRTSDWHVNTAGCISNPQVSAIVISETYDAAWSSAVGVAMDRSTVVTR